MRESASFRGAHEREPGISLHNFEIPGSLAVLAPRDDEAAKPRLRHLFPCLAIFSIRLAITFQ